MTITARGVAVICGVILGGFGLLGFLVTPGSAGERNFLLASWLLPITLFPAAALAAALTPETPRSVSGQSTVIWPAYAGLALYAVVTGHRWYDAAHGRHEDLTRLVMMLVIAVHAVVFLAGGGIFAVFPKTRPAGFQIWLAYPVLLGLWVLGGFVL
jgi:hypothetical protein